MRLSAFSAVVLALRVCGWNHATPDTFQQTLDKNAFTLVACKHNYSPPFVEKSWSLK